MGKLHLAKTSQETLSILERDRNFNINELDKHHRTALFYCKDVSQLTVLLIYGIDINIIDNNGYNALFTAQLADITQLLCNRGINVILSNCNRTALHFSKSAAQTKVLLTYFKNIGALALINQQDNNGCTALHLASSPFQSDLLIKAGANISLQDNNNYTALHHSSSAEQSLVLIEAGIFSPSVIKTPEGHFVCNDRTFSQHPKWRCSPLHLAKSPQQSQVLIDAGMSVNEVDFYGCTPLHYSSTLDQSAVLINSGANINAKDYRQRTPLHNSRTAIHTQFLIDKGADVSAVDCNGRTPIEYALTEEQARIISRKLWYR